MKLYLTCRSERAEKGQGGNDYLEAEIQAEMDDGSRPIIAKLNIFNDKEKCQYLLTFQPLRVQKFESHQSGKALALETKTERWCCAK